MVSYCMRAVRVEDAPTIASIMKRAQDALINPSMYLINTERLVRRRIERGSLGDVIEIEGKVCAFSIYRNPPAEQLEKSIGYRPGFPSSEYGKVIVVGSIAVDPGYQRMGLGGKLLARIERVAEEMGCLHLMTTVDPDNAGSMANFSKAGYQVVATKEAYSSVGVDYVFDTVPTAEPTKKRLMRNILHKEVSAVPVARTDSTAGDGEEGRLADT